MKLLGEPNRLKIVLSCLDFPLAVTEIAHRLKLAQSLVSHHLRLLRAGHILRPERRGKQVFYTTANKHIRRVIQEMALCLQESVNR